MKNVFFIILLTFGLTACADFEAQRQQQNNLNYCNGLSPWLRQAECMDHVSSNDTTGLFNDPGAQQLIAFRRVLIDNVRAHRMSDNEAYYAFQQKIGQMNQQLAQLRTNQQNIQPVFVPQQQSAYTIPTPTVTDCNRTAFGASCTTRRTGLDTSVFDRIKTEIQ